MLAEPTGRAPIARDTILADVTEILRDMTRDWDSYESEEIRRESRLIADLGFESIDVVALVSELEERFNRRDLPFVELVTRDGRYLDDVQVGEVVDFLAAHLGR